MASGFAAYFAVVWFFLLQALIRPQRLPWTHLAGVAGFTLVVGTGFALWAEEHLGGPGDAGPVGWTIAAGLPEEVAKLLGVLVCSSMSWARATRRAPSCSSARSAASRSGPRRPSSRPATSLGAVVGTPRNWSSSPSRRLLADSLLHACMAGITAFFLGLAHQRARQFTALVVTGLLVAGVLHGIYDAAADAGDALAVLVFAGVLATFIAYAERGEGVLERLAGLSPADPPAALSTEAL